MFNTKKERILERKLQFKVLCFDFVNKCDIVALFYDSCH